MRRSHFKLRVLTVLAIWLHVDLVTSQGRLQLPLGRSSVWRSGVEAPKNYDDHMLECGGLWYKMKRNNECGICGDPVDKPRDNENGGKFDSGIIAGSYAPGQTAQFKVLMNSNYGGYMEFKMCPTQWVSQGCFNKHPIQMADGSGTRFYLPDEQQGVVNVDVKMPDMTCESCVMQWTYTGNSEWGFDKDGNLCKGCGPQYELRNCADIAVMPGPPKDVVPPEIEDYNKNEMGGQSPSGSYFFDPDLKSPFTPPPKSGSPFTPPSFGNNNNNNNKPDPWNNQRPPTMNQSPRGRQPMNQSPGSDPWPNQRQPTMNQSPPRNQFPYAPPPQRNTNQDPWNNPQGTIQSPYAPPQRNAGPNSGSPPMSQSPPQRQPMNQSPSFQSPYAPPQRRGGPDPNSGSPNMNKYPYGIPPQRTRSPDPWVNSGSPTMTQRPMRRQPMNRSPSNQSPMNQLPSNQSPYAPPQRSGNPDPWVNSGGPGLNSSPKNNQDPWLNSGSPSTSNRQPMNNNNNKNQDPWVNSGGPSMNQSPQPSNPIPYAPPPRQNNNADPQWKNSGGPSMNESPSQGRLPMTQSPYAPPQGINPPDPWLNSGSPSKSQSPPRRQPTMNQSPPRRQPMNQSPYAPPPQGNNNNNPDPWVNSGSPPMNQSPPRKQPTMSQSPPRRQPPMRSGNPDPWVNQGQPMNQSPQGSNPIPYAPPQNNNNNNNNNNQDPWMNSQPSPMNNNNNNNNQDPWVNSGQPNPSNNNYNNNNNNNNGDPWQNSPPYAPPMQSSVRNTPSRIQQGVAPIHQPVVNSYQIPGNGPQGPPPQGLHVPPEIRSIAIIKDLPLDLPPRVTCVATGSKKGTEGMDEWCTENCNLEYCPEALCSCW